MQFRKVVAILAAVAALLAGLTLSTGAAQAGGKSELQQRMADYKAQHPTAKQIDADTLRIPGGTVTLATDGGASTLAISCSNYHLCIRDGYGDYYDYYYCGYYDFWGIGDGVFNNNQSWGTRAKFYNENGTLRWSNVAKDTGTASWTPVWHIRPC